MKDYLNQNINIGDKVVYVSSRRYGRLTGPYEVVNVFENNVGIEIYPEYNKNLKRLSRVTPKRLLVVSKLLCSAD